MAYDGLVMAAVKDELAAALIKGRIDKIYQPLTNEILIMVHKDRTKYRLLISSDAQKARIHLTAGTKENPFTPPMFCMVLRKHLEGGRITAIEQNGLERVLVISIEAVDELGMLSEKKLYCEVMGKHSNIVLVEPKTNTILDGINRFSYGTSRHREILPGRQYVAPPESGKLNPLTVTEETFIQTIWAREESLPLHQLILENFEGFSPQTCKEVVKAANLRPETDSSTLGEIDLQKLWQVMQFIQKSVHNSEYSPLLYKDEKGRSSFTAIHFNKSQPKNAKTGNMNDILDTFFSNLELREKMGSIVGELSKIVSAETKKLDKKIAIYEDTMKTAVEAEKWRIYGELLTANLYQIPERVEAVDLPNYYSPDLETVHIPMEFQKTAAENAQLYYKKYNKAKTARDITIGYLEKAREERSYLETISLSLAQAETIAELNEIRDELVKSGYSKEKAPQKGAKAVIVSESKPTSFQVEGFEVLAGRNNRQNDQLTMRLAQPDDIWLHVKDIPGCHVIIHQGQSTELPDIVLEKAAQIAAYYSKARNGSKVAVDYTKRKHVRKPKGAKPGYVIYEQQKTVFVQPQLPEPTKEEL